MTLNATGRGPTLFRQTLNPEIAMLGLTEIALGLSAPEE
jgi:hypothetical protein